MIENILSIAGYVQIGVAIIVVVADRDSHSVVAVSRIGQAGGGRDIGEAAVSVLPEQPIPVQRLVAAEIFRRLAWGS